MFREGKQKLQSIVSSLDVKYVKNDSEYKIKINICENSQSYTYR